MLATHHGNHLSVQYLMLHGFEAAVAIAAIISGLAFFTPVGNLGTSSAGILLSPSTWEYLWNAMFLIGGLLTIFGLGFPTSNFVRGRFHTQGASAEVAGLIFLSGALLVNVVATVAERGVTPGIFTLFALCVATLLRVYFVVKRDEVVVVASVGSPRSRRAMSVAPMLAAPFILGVVDIDVTNVLVAIIAIFSGGGIAALFRIKPDRDSVVVTSAQGALVVQQGALQAQLEITQQIRAELKETQAERDQFEARALRAERLLREHGIHAESHPRS